MASQGLTLDTGALIAAEKESRAVWALIKRAADRKAQVTVPAPVLAQVWRSGTNAQVARMLKACVVEEMTEASAKRIGKLLAGSQTADVVDGAVVSGAVARGDVIVTSDRNDIDRLISAAGRAVQVVPI